MRQASVMCSLSDLKPLSRMKPDFMAGGDNLALSF